SRVIPRSPHPRFELEPGVTEGTRELERSRQVWSSAFPCLVADHPRPPNTCEEETHRRRITAIAELGERLVRERNHVVETELLRVDRSDERDCGSSLVANLFRRVAEARSEKRERLLGGARAGGHVGGEGGRAGETE